ncbi:MAG: hypothetical protein K9M45_11435 [Kiritimatiellales bacterium]|nr:hypothetical protein [Kiritimatiellales bacterium]
MNILFVGNSHTYYNELQDMFATLARAGSEENVYSVRCTGPGVPLGWHCESPETLAMVEEREWDMVVLQDRSGAPLETPDEMVRSAEFLAGKVRAHCDARIFLYMTWANLLGFEQQDLVTAKYLELQKQLGCELAPVGVAWKKALETVPGLRLHDDDNRHANPFGTYLAALVFYKAVLGKDPVGLPNKIESNGDVLADVPSKLAAQLQQIAAEIV